MNVKQGIWPANSAWLPSGDVTIAGVSLIDIAADYGTPVIIYDETDFKQRCARFARAFGAANVHYASKAFLSVAIAHWVDQQGLALDVCSQGELYIAQTAQFPPERITFHGNNKTDTELTAAIEYGVAHIVIDSEFEIARLEKIAQHHGVIQDVFLRLTLGITAHTHEYIATSHEDQKFGFSVAHKIAHKAVAAVLSSSHLRLVGLHSHIGSQINQPEGFILAATRMFDFIAELIEEFGSQKLEHLRYCDLGGGFGIAYIPSDKVFNIEDFSATVHTLLADKAPGLHRDDLVIQVEPGRAIIGPTGVTLYTVGTVKDVHIDGGSVRKYISVDGGMSDNIRPALYEAEYTAELIGRKSSAQLVNSRVVGKHCESGDIIVHNCLLPADINPGDLLLIAATGAYCYSMSSRYNAQTRPAVVAVSQGCASLILRRETFADVLSLEVGT